MKWIHIGLGALFLLFAAWQFNDPDPWRWAALYGFVSVHSLLLAFGKGNRRLAGAGALVCLLWMGSLLPEFLDWLRIGTPNIATTMKASTPYVEYTREFLGLGLSLLVLGFQTRSGRRTPT
jgi:hypothetical protein